MTKQQLFDLIEDLFAVKPDNPFESIDAAVFRHKGNRKWFALLMQVPKCRMGLGGDEIAEVLNLKCDPLLREGLMKTKGVYECYHMNKVHWISVILDEIDDKTLETLLEISFDLTKK